MLPAYIDFETWSPEPISRGHRRYIGADGFRVLCLALRVDGRTTLDPGRDELERVAAGRIMVAHNAPFDAAVWEACGLPPARWRDTLPRARAAGLPGSLHELGRRLEGRGKDDAGRRALDWFVRQPSVPPPHLPVWGVLRAYCARDVELLETVDRTVAGALTPFEESVVDTDRSINARGAPVDTAWLREVGLRLADAQADAEHAFRGVTGGLNPRSPQQVRAWLAGRGYELDSVGQEQLRDLTVRDEDEDVAEAVACRRDLARVVAGKVAAGSGATDDDGRLRDQFAYCAQASGRWSSYGLAFHNMPRPLQGPGGRALDTRPLAADPTALDALMGGLGGTGLTRVDALSTALRHAVQCERMMVADFGQVEARLLAWLCDERGMLEAFADPRRSVYCETASRVFGRAVTKSDTLEYFVGKQLTLGCGYGMAGLKFQGHLRRLGGGEFALDRCEAWVQGFRRAWPAIPALWRELDAALAAVVRGGAGGASAARGRLRLWRDSSVDGFRMELPSGRCLTYRGAAVRERVPPWGGAPVPSVSYEHPRFGLEDLWGSKLTGHAVQGSARDLLAALLVALETGGFEPFLHVHDEAACQRGGFTDFMGLASVPPAWAAGLPLQAEGYVGTCWSKVHDGWESAVWQCGRAVA